MVQIELEVKVAGGKLIPPALVLSVTVDKFLNFVDTGGFGFL
jgi:hypothetical protein